MMRWLAIIILALPVLLFTGCAAVNGEFNPSRYVNVISREDGSGTRGAFTDIFEIVEKGEAGTRKDRTTKEAIIARQTDVMMVNVVNDQYAIGYISLGSLNDTVKPLTVDCVTPTPENVMNGSYAVTRPFNLAVEDSPEGLVQDFIAFILSREGQGIVAKSYIPVDNTLAPYSGNRPSGKIVVAGSSSVTPIMEKLKEAYVEINPSAQIEIQQSDSSAGMTGVIDGTCDIGMSSRYLNEGELKSLTEITIAVDAIVIIVNNKNPIEGLSKNQARDIFTGGIEKWEELVDE